MPKYFRQSRLSSFQRQLNIYGFKRITTGHDVDGYYHELFLKDRPSLAVHMRRVGVKGTKKTPSRSERAFGAKDPNFYTLPAIKLPTEATLETANKL